MNILKAVEDAWSKTIRDFEEAKNTGDAWLWTEDTLRLYFFRYFCEQDIKISRIMAETVFHVGEKDYKPDLVISIVVNGAIETIVFEFKYFGREWKEAWTNLQKFGFMGWHYGYFLAIGRSWQCDEVPKEVQKHEVPYGVYETRALTHPTLPLRFAPDFKIAELLLKKTLKGIPYLVSEPFGAVALFEKFYIYFDMTAREDKCVVWATLFGELKDEGKLRDVGYDKWVSFDDSVGHIQPTDRFTGDIFIAEFEANTYNSNVKKVKDNLDKFREKIRLLLKQA